MVFGKKIGLAVGVLLSVAWAPAFAAQPSEQQVRKLMDVIGLGNSLSQMNSQVAASMKQALPCVSTHYWDSYINDNSKQEFIGRLVPVYQKHFSADEVDGLIKFYSSPLGQKVLTEMPLAMAEANQAGQQWSHEHGQQMIDKLKQAGTLAADGRCPGTAAPSGTSLAPASAATTAADDGDDDDGEKAAPVAVPVHGTTHRHAGTTTRKHVPAHKTTPAKKTTSKSKHPATKSASEAAGKSGTATSGHPATTTTKKKAKPAATPATPPSGQGG